ncbi:MULTISPECIES: HNH endonuclease signature motif containing protein [unclassified Microbacterium]|uniref:HNH endonuclease signature motif containing protein n=1 Tax=unclassified Microbacterium TaxID=2609290 RepID=UPI00214AB6C4|nr:MULTISPECIES: HNH endonuclease signature motif containing protein [unclassified Microbacterium]MCR2784502.1 HNH endonuclease [Microbacterium sp. zg.B96]WIM14686.1 DUF222 domain-containing protein [Microbacterium sp. zg-B96]
MAFFFETQGLLDKLHSTPELDVEHACLAAALRELDSERVLGVLADATALIDTLEHVRIAAAGVAAERSSRDRGYGGLAQTKGHRTPTSLIQSITGQSIGEVKRHVRLGEALLDGADAAPPAPVGAADAAGAPTPPPPPWHEPLRTAMLGGILTPAQHDAIMRGLGTPPTRGADAAADETTAASEEAQFREIWRVAAEQLIEEARDCTAEDLLRRARYLRDQLDESGAADRFQQRYEARSFRMWQDEHGQHRAHLVLDDEMAAWIRAMVDAALRPRRGGPRFVTAEEHETADQLVADPRSNEQLEYDLLMDTLKAGSLAAAEAVFGARQPGVRVVVTVEATGRRDAFGRAIGVGHLEDGGAAVAGPVIERTLCTTGYREVVVDGCGNPLDLGREQRLFSAKQRIAMAVRDGGCMAPGCPVPASYCEAHHCNQWQRGGRTDVDEGILLCRFHHMLLHNNGWWITRDGLGPFVLHAPSSLGRGPVVLRSKSPLFRPLVA